MSMDFLEPWASTEGLDERFHATFLNQLKTEVGPGHPMFEKPAKLIARGNGDDCLFKLLDGTERVAVVHLTWAKHRERLPFPGTSIYESIQEWRTQCMLPEHKEWQDD
jgi:hypothetical protein